MLRRFAIAALALLASPLTAALCGLFQGMPPIVGGLTSSGIVTALPPAAWVSSWTSRLRAEKTAPLGKDATCGKGSGVHQSLGFLFLGDGRVAQPDQAFALHVGRPRHLADLRRLGGAAQVGRRRGRLRRRSQGRPRGRGQPALRGMARHLRRRVPSSHTPSKTPLSSGR